VGWGHSATDDAVRFGRRQGSSNSSCFTTTRAATMWRWISCCKVRWRARIPRSASPPPRRG
jgi:hypothetical protein